MFCLYDMWDAIGKTIRKKSDACETLEISVKAAYIVFSVNEGGNICKVKYAQTRSRWDLSLVLTNVFCCNTCDRFKVIMMNSSLYSKADMVIFTL